ncbi:hypothetical protein IEQ34_005294 [Dendrobium chrysotoxum]|uniref:Reverse transcriptase zinc-binding domain-containing protein n=1 Tax=Dendrobium chrysotoxum TaxID=161865 RepID=A0AAV7H8G7_DENCH|nr:hypothetical protein IEQ34_005294 [Dendrobium chrysotoxum]
MPTMDLLLLLPLLLAADLEDTAFHDLYLNILLFEAGEIGLDNVSLWRLPPIEERVDEDRNLRHEIGARSIDGVMRRKEDIAFSDIAFSASLSSFLGLGGNKKLSKLLTQYNLRGCLTIQNGLKTADVLAVRNIFINSICPLCDLEEESISHLFFQCKFTFHALELLLPNVKGFFLRPTLLQLFEFFDEKHKLNSSGKAFCFSVICCLVYFMWREKNDRRYGRKFCNSATICHKVSMAITAKTSKWKHFDSIKASFPDCFSHQYSCRPGSIGVSGE